MLIDTRPCGRYVDMRCRAFATSRAIASRVAAGASRASRNSSFADRHGAPLAESPSARAAGRRNSRSSLAVAVDRYPARVTSRRPRAHASRPVSRSSRSREPFVTNESRRARREVLGYTFKNPQLLKESLTHASIADNRLNSNERMEFLGDAVLDLIICEALYLQLPRVPRGRPDEDQVGRRLAADVRGGRDGDGADRPADHRQGHQLARADAQLLAAAVYESIVAAIYLDGGFEVVKEYVLRTMTPKIEEIAANTHQQNYKAVLQQHAQKMLGATPMYELLDEKGPDHSKCFEVCVMHRRPALHQRLGPEQEDGRAEGGAAGAGRAGRAGAEGSGRGDRADRRNRRAKSSRCLSQ